MFSSAIERLNDRRNGAGEAGADAGFTLIELMVVLLILAILLAIAIPTFLGVTGGANDRAAQSNLNTALTTAKSAATENNQSYINGSNPVTLALLQKNEPSIQWVSGATGTQGDVSFYVSADGNGIVLSSPSKNQFTGRRLARAGTWWTTWLALRRPPVAPMVPRMWELDLPLRHPAMPVPSTPPAHRLVGSVMRRQPLREQHLCRGRATDSDPLIAAG